MHHKMAVRRREEKREEVLRVLRYAEEVIEEQGRMMDEQDWPKEPWRKSKDGYPPFIDANGEDIYLDEETGGLSGPLGDRILACMNACTGIPTECLERVEQGKSSIIVADEVLNGQRTHFVMPDSTIT